jgi:hypothetical protein
VVVVVVVVYKNKKIEHATNKTSTCKNNKTIYMKYWNKTKQKPNILQKLVS